MNSSQALTGLQLAIRAAVAAGVSLALAQLLHLQHPIYALIAAVIVTDLAPSQSRELGLRRIIATIVGALWGALLSQLLPPGPWTAAFGILVAILICHALNAREAAKIAAYICAIVILDHRGEPWSYAAYRFAETALGIGVAWAVSYVPKLINVEDNADAERK